MSRNPGGTEGAFGQTRAAWVCVESGDRGVVEGQQREGEFGGERPTWSEECAAQTSPTRRAAFTQPYLRPAGEPRGLCGPRSSLTGPRRSRRRAPLRPAPRLLSPAPRFL